jgi:hypothetical protein
MKCKRHCKRLPVRGPGSATLAMTSSNTACARLAQVTRKRMYDNARHEPTRHAGKRFCGRYFGFAGGHKRLRATLLLATVVPAAGLGTRRAPTPTGTRHDVSLTLDLTHAPPVRSHSSTTNMLRCYFA